MPGLVFTAAAAGTVALWGWLVSFGLLLVRARLVAGHWPYPRSGNPLLGTYRDGAPGPRELGALSDITFVWLIACFYVVPLAVLVLVASFFSRHTRPPATLTAVFLAALALAGTIVVLDPGGFLFWFGD